MRELSGREKMLEYFKRHIGKWVHNQELRKVTGLNDTPRTIRALRQEGWQIEVRGDGHSRLLSLEKSQPRGKRKPVSRKLRFQILYRDHFRCKACGRGPDDNVKLVVDHIIPVDWGGLTEEFNLQALCEDCNSGKKAWIGGRPPKTMEDIFSIPTVEGRIEGLFDAFPDEDIPSTMIQFVSKGAFDWQRALRRIRQRTGKKILPDRSKNTYRYFKE